MRKNVSSIRPVRSVGTVRYACDNDVRQPKSIGITNKPIITLFITCICSVSIREINKLFS